MELMNSHAIDQAKLNAFFEHALGDLSAGYGGVGRVEDNLSPVARLYYAASTTLCCAHAVSEGGHLVLGAQAGEARLAGVFRKAGFSHFRRASETPFNLIFEVRC